MNHIRATTAAQAAHDETSDPAPFTGQGVTGMVMDLEHTTGNDEINSSIAGYWPDKALIQEDSRFDGSNRVHGANVFAIAHASDGSKPLEGMAPNASGVVANATPLTRFIAAQNLTSYYEGTIQIHSWGTIPDGLRELLSDAGYPALNSYDLRAVEEDLVGYQAGTLAFQAMGNVGPGRAAGEAVAKNGLSIGGIYHYDDTDRSDNTWGYNDTRAKSHQSNEGLASTGPTWDCRIKPDLVGAFEAINTWGHDGDQTQFKHTSGATPVVAGATMLAEEMYRDGLFLNASQHDTSGRPSPAILKALTINSAHSFTVNQTWDDEAISNSGCGPDTEDPQPRHTRDIQGWGQPDLRGLLATGADTFALNEPIRLDTGDRVNYTVTLPDWVDGLRVTLTWTDPPGTPLANSMPLSDLTDPVANLTASDEAVPRQLANDLDVEVEAPDGSVYPGNRGMGNASATQEGNKTIDADSVNNVENVVTDAPVQGESGEWTVQVEADQVQLPHDPDGEGYGQPFGLVIRPLDDEGSSDGGGGCCSSGGGLEMRTVMMPMLT